VFKQQLCCASLFRHSTVLAVCILTLFSSTSQLIFQIANIYVSVTAGSIFKSLQQILEHPYNALIILGQELPTVAGYFISLLLTKILAGLPMVLLRGGALSRMVFLKIFFREKNLTQRELDEVYRELPIMYGWEVSIVCCHDTRWHGVYKDMMRFVANAVVHSSRSFNVATVLSFLDTYSIRRSYL
jgi:hypothetical protein